MSFHGLFFFLVWLMVFKSLGLANLSNMWPEERAHGAPCHSRSTWEYFVDPPQCSLHSCRGQVCLAKRALGPSRGKSSASAKKLKARAEG